MVFERAHNEVVLTEGGAVATKRGVGFSRAAACKVAMCVGRHFAQFTVLRGPSSWPGMMFGLLRPGYDVEDGANEQEVYGHCFYNTFDGKCYPGGHNWEGRQTAREEGDRIGLLLDLDQASMTVYKNDEWLGVMATGLSGEYSWAV